MTNAKQTMSIEEMTNEVVLNINKQAVVEKDAWIEQGRLITEYIKQSKEAKGTNDDAFKRLADHPDCVHGVGQLRNYWKAYEVYKGLGDLPGGLLDLPMTFYAVMQSDKLTFFVRESLLKQATKNNWSVSDLKAEIKRLFPSKKSDSSKPIIISQLKSVFSEIQKHDFESGKGWEADSVHDEVITLLNRIFNYASEQGWVGAKDDIPEDLHDDDISEDLFEEAA